MEKGGYSDKPLVARLLLFIVAFFDFPMALVVVYLLKENVKKEDKWKLEFLDRGAKMGLSLLIILAVIELGVIIVKGFM